jgi:Protein kinase domain
MADLPSETSDPSADRAYGIMEWPRIPGYEIEGRVGAGGMAVVFRAHDERLRRPVALKVITPALAADDGFRRRFIREARAAAMVDHPHIIPVFAAGESDGLLFIAMRFVAGGDVRSILDRSGAMSAGRATGVISAVGSALDAAHRAGLVHRDVKPANMLIDVRPGRPDHVYLSDFGLSKGALDSGGVTRTGHVVGTPAYLAPEQGSGGKVDGRTDQYSLACVAYELLTGIPPFLRDDAAAMVYAHLWEPPPLATARQPSLPSAVDPVLARAMSKDPDQRFLTCQEFAESLRAALGLRPHDADPGMSVGDGARDGALSHDAPVPAVTPDDRDIPPAAGANGSPAAASPPPASGGPGRAPAGKSAPGGSDRIRPRVRRDGRARTRRRIVRLSVTALALAALTLAGVVVAVRVSRSPRPAPVIVGAFRPVPGGLTSVSIGPNRQAVIAGYTCGKTCGTWSEIDRLLIAEQNGSQWSRLAVPGIPGSPRFTGVTVSPDRTIYAVGYTCLAHCGTAPEIDRPLILRWRGGLWSRFAYPSTVKPALLTGVSLTKAGTIFAVGYTCKGGCGFGSSVSDDRPLILRSDGSTWSRVSISPSLRRGASLSAVSTQPDGKAWAAGDACTPVCKALILHWDGSAWRRVPSQSPGGSAELLDISTTATGGWASGLYDCKPHCSPHEPRTQTLILRWSGHSWLQVNSPSLGQFNVLYAITGAAHGTAWAAGTPSCGVSCGSPRAARGVILRSDGSDWSQATPSPAGQWWIAGIAAEPDGGAIAVGHTIGVGHPVDVGRVCTSPCGATHEVDRTLLLRWNGSRWSVVG